ncbi:MAG TPA: UDP-N-acetylmuramoyl-L-alanyl-D-glutamate--2,6-diaminopimelate ligase [Candidatus Eisenbacteria bacterium]|nr:UDP-N-acetylmuramoyl-L-alanyl-D-glutamate--2,6-diaminopimelate ligase [Candidatus Eisenbacteria bacterium]
MWQALKNQYHLLVAILANLRYAFPGRKLIIIGVTGTDGKTTTASLIYHILKSTGRNVSLISTVSAIINGQVYDTGFHVTNPASFPLQRFLSLAVKAKKSPSYLVLEVTSHGLDQSRVWGIPFAIGVVTNVSHEHLDYHKTYDNYLKTKAKLLRIAHTAIINKDDMSYEPFKKILKSKKVLTYSAEGDGDVVATDINLPKHFLGIHNLYNALAATTVSLQLSIPIRDINTALDTFVFPTGRGELVYTNGFSVMVDFAHTPNSFDYLLSSLRPQVKGRLIHVFGCAGKRDTSKRPLMGKFASLYDDVIILTSEDPRGENQDAIAQQVRQGMQKKALEVMVIHDREEAIKKAISIARKGDFIVITGKAHEKSMNYGKGEEPWDEFKVIEDALKNK